MSFSATAVGTGAGATATQAAQTGATYIATAISGHTDTDSLITIESPAGTVLWESKIDISLEGFSFHFGGLYVPGVADAAIVGKVASSAADAQVNISGTESRRS
jgi:hypothetical protein